MKFCPKCGTALPESAVFCPKCGYDISSYRPSKPSSDVGSASVNPTPIEPTPITPSAIEPKAISPTPINSTPIVSWFLVSSILLGLTGIGFLINVFAGIAFLVLSIGSLFLLFFKLSRFSFSKAESKSLSERLPQKDHPVSAENIEKSTGLSRLFYFFQAKGKTRLFVGLSIASIALLFTGSILGLSSSGGVVADPVGDYQDYYKTGSTRYIIWEIRSDKTWDYVYDNGDNGVSGTWTSFGHNLELYETESTDTTHWVISIDGETITSGEHLATRIQE